MENIIKALISRLQALKIFSQIEPYDGQFESENISEWQIIPPAVFIDIVRSENLTSAAVCERWSFDLIIVASHITGAGSSTLAISDLISSLKSEFQHSDLFYSSSHLGRIFIVSAENFINLPGLKVWKISFFLE